MILSSILANIAFPLFFIFFMTTVLTGVRWDLSIVCALHACEHVGTRAHTCSFEGQSRMSGGVFSITPRLLSWRPVVSGRLASQ